MLSPVAGCRSAVLGRAASTRARSRQERGSRVQALVSGLVSGLVAAVVAPVVLATGSIIATAPGSGGNSPMIVEVYADADAFAELRRPVRRILVAAGDAEHAVVIEDLEPGNYALMAFRDRNGNGVLDRSFIGIPKEPVAFSQGYAPKGPPVFDRASFTVARG